ncbi:Putative NADP-dependent oxidoreductase YfmJ (plasmid) [Variovorax sp. PBL-E5]|nr:Putative NADP-dependent oxidoreductase YfmJ [Variovorax sp. PBL-E5]
MTYPAAMTACNLQVRLHSLPDGAVGIGNFELSRAPMPVPGPGQVLTRTLYLSLDPYMRKRMQEARQGRAALRPGDPMIGRTLGVVEAGAAGGFAAGDLVLGWAGWQSFAAQDAERLVRVTPLEPSSSPYLGALGRPGITAWLGMVHLGQVRQGETVLVSSAAGAVGSVAAQIARRFGARAIGIAGGAGKCAWLKGELGFDEAVDYTAFDFERQLEQATPSGVDLCFESVGAAVLDAALSRMNPRGRIALCGLLGHYQSDAAHAFANFARLLDRGLALQGFRIDDFEAQHAQAAADLARWWHEGALRQHETMTEGLENAPAAFVGMLAGRGFGKHIVRVS